MVAGRLALGLGWTPFGSPKPPALTEGWAMLFATSVGCELANMPTLGCGGGVTRLGGAGASLGASSWIFISAILGGWTTGWGLGSSIFGCSSKTLGGGA